MLLFIAAAAASTATTNSLERLSLRDLLIGNASCFSVFKEAGLGLISTCWSHVPLVASRVTETIPKINVRLHTHTHTQKRIGRQWIVLITALFR